MENEKPNIFNTMKLIANVEFNSPYNLLHKNRGESNYTFYGIYRKFHPELKLWKLVDSVMRLADFNIKRASKILYDKLESDEALRFEIAMFYKRKFWDKMKLNYVQSQHKCDELMIFAINVNTKQAIKTVQRMLGVTADGIIGPITLKAINNYDEDEFNRNFDKHEVLYHKMLVRLRPGRFKRFLVGWINRDYKV